mmetsp:Transcript_1434/g.3102  ORF Transcript_1434/g.3102 Transcript_1434/m.3102 type:complete len:175 (-) Transcript_1434:552-1076(-)
MGQECSLSRPNLFGKCVYNLVYYSNTYNTTFDAGKIAKHNPVFRRENDDKPGACKNVNRIVKFSTQQDSCISPLGDYANRKSSKSSKKPTREDVLNLNPLSTNLCEKSRRSSWRKNPAVRNRRSRSANNNRSLLQSKIFQVGIKKIRSDTSGMPESRDDNVLKKYNADKRDEWG